MGGSITMIIKEKEDKIHKMCRWTNSFPSFIKHPKFLSKDPQHLSDYLKSWLEMKEDYEKNKLTGNFQHNMTSVYLPDSGYVAPVEYGIIFIDLVKNKIISCQGYSDIDGLSLGSIIMAHKQLKHDNAWQENIDAAQELFNQSRLKNLSSLDPKNKRLPKQLEGLNQSKNFIHDVLKANDTIKDSFGLYLYSYKIDMSPFEVKHYPDDHEGFKSAYKDIKELIDLSPVEEEKWKEYFKLYEDEE